MYIFITTESMSSTHLPLQKGMLSSLPQCIILGIPATLSQWWHIWFWLSISRDSSGNCIVGMSQHALLGVMSIGNQTHLMSSVNSNMITKWMEHIPQIRNLILEVAGLLNKWTRIIFWLSDYAFLTIPVQNCMVGMSIQGIPSCHLSY